MSDACPADEQNVVWLTESISVNPELPGDNASSAMIIPDATDRLTMCEPIFFISFLCLNVENHQTGGRCDRCAGDLKPARKRKQAKNCGCYIWLCGNPAPAD